MELSASASKSALPDDCATRHRSGSPCPADRLGNYYTERYADAAALQERVLGAAAGAGRFFELPRLQAELSAYREETPWREPFAPMDPVFQPSPLDPMSVFREYPTTAAY